MSRFTTSSSTASTFSSTAATSSDVVVQTTTNVTKVTTHIPLTTIFTPPPDCTDIPYTYSESQSGLSTFWRDASGPGNGTHSSCYPPNFSYENKPNITVQYSPGVCPSGYVVASATQNPARAQFTSWCCPAGMSYAPSYGCYTTISTPTVVMLNSLTNVTMTTAFVAADWYIPVAWATGQLNEFTPRSAPLLAPQTSAANTSTAVPVPGLNSEAVAGIGVGGAVGFVAIVAVACYALWRRKRRLPRDLALLGEEGEARDLPSSEAQKRADSCQGEDPGSVPAMTQQDTSYLMGGQHSGARMRDGNPLGWTVDRQPSFPIDETQPATEPR